MSRAVQEMGTVGEKAKDTAVAYTTNKVLEVLVGLVPPAALTGVAGFMLMKLQGFSEMVANNPRKVFAVALVFFFLGCWFGYSLRRLLAARAEEREGKALDHAVRSRVEAMSYIDKLALKELAGHEVKIDVEYVVGGIDAVVPRSLEALLKQPRQVGTYRYIVSLNEGGTELVRRNADLFEELEDEDVLKWWVEFSAENKQRRMDDAMKAIEEVRSVRDISERNL